jgi:hypothetical protein
MKTTTLVYCGEDDGTVLAASLRDGKSYVVMCSAGSFVRADRHADRVVFTDDVPQRLRQAISAAHGLSLPVSMEVMPDEQITIITPPAKRRGRPRKAA